MKGNDSPIVKYGLIALVVLGIVFAVVRFSGMGSDEGSYGETPPPREEGEVLPPLDPKYIIGNDPNDPKPIGK